MWLTFQAAGKLFFVLVLGVVFATSLGLGVASIVDSAQPTYWGTFTEVNCTPSRFGCQSIGTWTSDDGTIVKRGIALDGSTVNGLARASYQPGGINSDASNNIVHTDFGTSAKVWLPWAFCVLIAALLVNTGHTWGMWTRLRKRTVEE